MDEASNLVEVTVKLPVARMADFYEWFGRWLAAPVAEEPLAATKQSWGAGDVEEAVIVWKKLSPLAKGFFSILIGSPTERFTGQRLAEMAAVPNGRYGVAGLLAWPGRHSYAVGRNLPWEYEEDATGQSYYWMAPEVAELFSKAQEMTSR